MKIAMNRVTFTILVAGAWLCLCATSRAQIASYVDEHGKVVYINGDSPRHASRSTIGSPSSGSKSIPVAAKGSSALSIDRTPRRPLSESERFAARRPVSDSLDRIVRAAAERHQVDQALVKAVISTESAWNPNAISSKGAVGLMQLIPGTAQRYGVGNMLDPTENVEGGTTYLKWLLDRYKGDLTKSLAAYNAGEHAVDQVGGVPAYPETQRYVQKVTDIYFQHDSGRDPSFWSPPRIPVRRDIGVGGRLVFTNQ